MSKKSLIIPLIILSLVLVVGLIFVFINKNTTEVNNPLAKQSKDSGNDKVAEKHSPTKAQEPTKVPVSEPFSVLLLGIDRRSKTETGFRTDIMILATVNQAKKKLLLTSVPRDLWINSSRINATFVSGGWEAMQNSFEKITGQKAIGYIQCDFEDLVWLIDSMGGVEIELDNSFTDVEYPNDVTKTYMTVNFEKGKQVVNGKDALVLSRSRHGNNGEGSDFKRMQRQHKLLKAMPNAILSPKSIFNPLNIPKFYELITQRLVTNLSLTDVSKLWDFYKYKDEYVTDSFYVDSEYLYNPPLSEYGGAWVLIAKGSDYTPIHLAIKEKVGIIEPKPQTKPSEPITPEATQ